MGGGGGGGGGPPPPPLNPPVTGTRCDAISSIMFWSQVLDICIDIRGITLILIMSCKTHVPDI